MPSSKDKNTFDPDPDPHYFDCPDKPPAKLVVEPVRPPAPKLTDLTLNDVTVGKDSLTGDGAFDRLMQACMAHLHKEYALGRITGDNYAQAYIATMGNALNAGIQFAATLNTTNNGNIMNAAQLDVVCQKLVTEKAQTQDLIDGYEIGGSVGKQMAVYDSNIKGFQQKALQDVTKLLVDTWTVRTTAGTGDTAPSEANRLHDEQIGEAMRSLLCSADVKLVKQK